MLYGFAQCAGPIVRRCDQWVQAMQGGVVVEEIG